MASGKVYCFSAKVVGSDPDRFFDGSVPNFLCRVNALLESILYYAEHIELSD